MMAERLTSQSLSRRSRETEKEPGTRYLRCGLIEKHLPQAHVFTYLVDSAVWEGVEPLGGGALMPLGAPPSGFCDLIL